MCSRLPMIFAYHRTLFANGSKYSCSRLLSSSAHGKALSKVTADEGTEEPPTTTISDGDQTIEVDRRSYFAFYLDKDVRRDLNNEKYKLSKHPGVRYIQAMRIPEELHAAVNIVLEDQPKIELMQQAKDLQNYIWDRNGPLEESDKEDKMNTIMQSVKSKEEVDPEHPAIHSEDRHVLMRQRHSMLAVKIRSEIYNYKPMDFSTPTSCLVYMLARLEGDYSSLVKVLHQLRSALPDFVPRSMLDFGSGVGSATWAVDKVWPRLCQETFNVDASGEMNSLHETLLRGGTAAGRHARRENSTFFRQFLPASGSIKHDLVMASRSLFELDSREVRLRTLDILWKTVSPGGCIVLVEVGNRRGCKYILEAREFLLEGVDHKSSYTRGKVIAPCPHQESCPLNKKKEKHRLCSDCTKFFPMTKHEVNIDVFSYIIIQKPLLNQHEEEAPHVGPSWPRVVQPVLRPGSMSIARVCNQFGNLQELRVTKGKHGAVLNRVGKATVIGDLLPVTLLPPDQHLDKNAGLYKKRKEKRFQNYHNNLEENSSPDEK